MRYCILICIAFLISCDQKNSNDEQQVVEAIFDVNPQLLSQEVYSDDSGFEMRIPKEWEIVNHFQNIPFSVEGVESCYFNKEDSSLLLMNKDSISMNFEGNIQNSSFVLNGLKIDQSVLQNESFIIFSLKIPGLPAKYLYYVLQNKDLNKKIRQVESSIGSITKVKIN